MRGRTRVSCGFYPRAGGSLRGLGLFFFSFNYIYIYGCSGFSLLSGLFSSCGKWGLLSVEGLASRVVEHGIWALGVQQLRQVGSMAAVPGPQSTGSVCVCDQQQQQPACGVLPDLFLLHWQADSLPLSHQRSSV